MPKITKKVFVRIGWDDTGEPCITAYGEDEDLSLEDGNIDTYRPYRDVTIEVSADVRRDIDTVAVDVPVDHGDATPALAIASL